MLVNQRPDWQTRRQRLALLPVNFVDLVRAALPHLQDPGAGVGLQLKVTLQKRDGSKTQELKRKSFSSSSRSQLSRGWRLTRFAMTMVSTMTGSEAVPRVNWRPLGGCPEDTSKQCPSSKRCSSSYSAATIFSTCAGGRDSQWFQKRDHSVRMNWMGKLWLAPRLGRCCPGRSGCWRTPPSSSPECSGWGWRGGTGACPGTWPWGQWRSCHQPGTAPLAPTRNGRNWGNTGEEPSE